MVGQSLTSFHPRLDVPFIKRVSVSLHIRFSHFDTHIYFDRSCPQTELLTADYRELPTWCKHKRIKSVFTYNILINAHSDKSESNYFSMSILFVLSRMDNLNRFIAHVRIKFLQGIISIYSYPCHQTNSVGQTLCQLLLIQMLIAMYNAKNYNHHNLRHLIKFDHNIIVHSRWLLQKPSLTVIFTIGCELTT